MFPFALPFLGRPILWYGFLFALGFFLAYFFIPHFMKRDFQENPQLANFKEDWKTHAKKVTERGIMTVGIGAVLGARLGDVFFYQNPSTWLHNPLSIFYIWEGGLASHGAVIGILIGLMFFARRLRREGLGFFTLFTLTDRAVPFVALAGCFIRIGNFVNQEILGIPTTVPWAVLFIHPADGGLIVPRHPAQLYESVAYLAIFGILYSIWTRRPTFRREGKSTGLFCLLVFGVRFFVEFVKVEQSTYNALPFGMTMGQWLSIPVIIFGLWLFLRAPKEPIKA